MNTPHKLLVCGGRHFSRYSPWASRTDRLRAQREIDFIYATLDTLVVYEPVKELICGMAEGADYTAYEWALKNGIPVKTFFADWNKYGNKAGSLRNLEMLKYGPTLVVAFPGGVGTAHMKAIARGENVEIREYNL